jgi:hypothetical protein
MSRFNMDAQWCEVLECSIALATRILSLNTNPVVDLFMALQIRFYIELFTTGLALEKLIFAVNILVAFQVICSLVRFTACVTMEGFVNRLKKTQLITLAKDSQHNMAS